MTKQYRVGEDILVKGIVNSEVSNGGIHVLHDGIDVFYTLDQIYGPEKPVVPKNVADWYFRTRLSGKDPVKAFTNIILKMGKDGKNEKSWWHKWIQENPNAIQIVVNMHQFGYEIEKEQLYTVEIPNPNNTLTKYKLMLCKGADGIEIVGDYHDEHRHSDSYHLTESEIKQDFEWAWQFAKPVLKEVE